MSSSMSNRANEYVLTQNYRLLALDTQRLKQELETANEALGVAQDATKAAQQKAADLQTKAAAFGVVADKLKCQTTINKIEALYGSVESGQELIFKGESGTHPDETLRLIDSVTIALHAEPEPDPEEEKKDEEEEEPEYDIILKPKEPLVILDKETGKEILDEPIEELTVFAIKLKAKTGGAVYGDLVECDPIVYDGTNGPYINIPSLFVKNLVAKPTAENLPSIGQVQNNYQAKIKVSVDQSVDQIKLELLFDGDDKLVLQAYPAEPKPEPEEQQPTP